jgi:hypothetical protein
MSSQQKFSFAAAEFHPELGYLCPSSQLRQNVRVGLSAAAFGIITGVAGTLALFPRHGSDLTRTERVLEVSPAGSVSHSTLLTSSGSTVAPLAVTSGTAERISIDGVAMKQLPPAEPIGPAVGTANKAALVLEPPAQAAPVTITRDTMAVRRGPEHVRTASNKRTRIVKRAREPSSSDAFATSHFGFQVSPFADGTRSGRRREPGDRWRW